MAQRKTLARPKANPRGERDASSAASLGWISGATGTAPLVDWEGNSRGPLRALTTVPLSAEVLLAAAAARQGAVLLFQGGDPARPILVGLIQPTTETPLLDAILGTSAHGSAKDARIDGRRVVVQGRDEIVLSCGEASITLRRNGRVTIRGIQLETRARGLQRIRGGKVEIN
jgi:hypothetical protein